MELTRSNWNFGFQPTFPDSSVPVSGPASDRVTPGWTYGHKFDNIRPNRLPAEEGEMHGIREGL